MKTEAYKAIDFYSKKDLVGFLNSLYDSNTNFDFFLNEYEQAYNFCCKSQHVKFFPLAFYDEEKMVAHVALIADDRLKKKKRSLVSSR